jgi:prephenate dehydratase
MRLQNIIAFQGIQGAYSDLAARAAMPDANTLAKDSFEDVFEAVRGGEADFGIVPIENSIAGRVADNHHLLPDSGLFIVAEHFQKIEHCLAVLPGTKLDQISVALSHPQALAQCRNRLRQMSLKPEAFGNTAMATAEIVKRNDPTVAAICSRLAAELNGLDVLVEDMQDEAHNTTRFVIVAREAVDPPVDIPVITTLIFRVRDVPAALYKALGGFATNGVTLTKLESYIRLESYARDVGGAQFYCDVEGRPAEAAMARALEELAFFSPYIRILGTYPAHAYRGRES